MRLKTHHLSALSRESYRKVVSYLFTVLSSFSKNQPCKLLVEAPFQLSLLHRDGKEGKVPAIWGGHQDLPSLISVPAPL